MSIQIDARLHLSQPEIILRNSQSGEILMRWYRATIQRWLANGDICYQDLRDPNYNWQELMQSTR